MTTSLVYLCLRTVSENMGVLENRLYDLPASLIKDLLPLLSIFHLDRIEKVAIFKKVSHSLQCTWAAKWRELNPTWRCKLKFMHPEQNWKQKCLECLFHMVLFRKTHVQSLLWSSDCVVLSLCAEHVQVLSLTASLRGGCRLASEDLRPILSILEKSVRSLRLFDAVALKHEHKDIMFILHRLLDHGSVTEVVLKRTPISFFLFSWITPRFGGPHTMLPQSSAAQDTRDTSCDLWAEEGPSGSKYPRLDLQTDEELSNEFSPCCSVNGQCSVGRIRSLDLELCSLTTLSCLLPSWLWLHSLHVYGSQPLWEEDVANFIKSLKKLFLNPCCSLRDLSMGNVFGQNLLASLLTACPTLLSLSLDINMPRNKRTTSGQNLNFKPDTELCLENLYIKSTEIQTVDNFPAVLQHAPNLSSLHITGIRQAHLLLDILPDSNPLLKVLILEDINLADCHQEIIHLLNNSILEELSLKDCRLLEKCTERKDFLVPFVEAARGLCSLHSLSLSQNRLATSAIDIADLFFEDCPSKISNLDLSSNFILPADLLEFSQRIETYHPTQRFKLDLRFNPLDRDPKVKNQAIKKLLPFCNILTDDWNSRSTMADHVSVM